MSLIQEKLIQILGEKNSPIGEMILKNMELFDEQELHQMYLILHQSDIEKLKELFLYQNSQAKALLDRIIHIAREVHHIEKTVESEQAQETHSKLEEYIEQSLEIHYSIS